MSRFSPRPRRSLRWGARHQLGDNIGDSNISTEDLRAALALSTHPECRPRVFLTLSVAGPGTWICVRLPILLSHLVSRRSTGSSEKRKHRFSVQRRTPPIPPIKLAAGCIAGPDRGYHPHHVSPHTIVGHAQQNPDHRRSGSHRQWHRRRTAVAWFVHKGLSRQLGSWHSLPFHRLCLLAFGATTGIPRGRWRMA